VIVSIFDTKTGLIDRTVDAPDDHIPIQVRDTESYVEGGYDSGLYYVDVDTGEVKMKGDFTLGTIPLPSVVTIEGQEYRCHEQPEFVFDAPGTYEIKVDAGPQYLEKVFQYDYQS